MKTKNRIFAIIMATLLTFTITGCGKDKTEPEVTPPPVAEVPEIEATVGNQDLVVSTDDDINKGGAHVIVTDDEKNTDEENAVDLKEDAYLEVEVISISNEYIVGRPLETNKTFTDIDTIYITYDAGSLPENYEMGDNIAILYSKIISSINPAKVFADRIITIELVSNQPENTTQTSTPVPETN